MPLSLSPRRNTHGRWSEQDHEQHRQDEQRDRHDHADAAFDPFLGDQQPLALAQRSRLGTQDVNKWQTQPARSLDVADHAVEFRHAIAVGERHRGGHQVALAKTQLAPNALESPGERAVTGVGHASHRLLDRASRGDCDRQHREHGRQLHDNARPAALELLRQVPVRRREAEDAERNPGPERVWTEWVDADRVTGWQDPQAEQREHYLLPEVLGRRYAWPKQIESQLEIARPDEAEAPEHGLQLAA